MPEKTDLNITPYYDDYDEDKKFHKVLFRAGRPLQARELTQSQSILQNQIERFGDHFFKEGSIVQGAQSDIDMETYYVKVSSANPNSLGDANVETFRESLHEKFLQGKTSGVIGKVITTSAETTDDALTLFVKYFSQGTDTDNSFTFQPNEELQIVTLDADGNATDDSSNNDLVVLASTDTPNGRASIANISEGVVFIRGFFCKVNAQELILEKYSGAPSYRVGLQITEDLITSGNDTSLLDNATGSNNENAAGADRLKVSLTLAKFALTNTDDVNFIELVRVNNGIIELQIDKPMYSHIENTLARRTFDANGDFIVRQFTHSFREHLDDTTNRGYYTSAYGGKEDRFVMQISPGKAYVKGYEIEKVGTSPLEFNKARTSVSLTSANTPIRLGNHLRVYNAHALPEFGNETGSSVIDPFNPAKLYPSTVGVAGTENSEDHIGLARIRDITLFDGDVTSKVYDDTSVFELSMFDIKMFTRIRGNQTGSFNNGDKVVGSSSGATAIVAYSNQSSTPDDLYVHDVVGSFVDGESISSIGTGSGAIASVSSIRNFNIDRVRSIAQVPNETSHETFTADCVVDSDRTLTGTVNFTNSSDVVTGFGTRFASELKEGDIIYNPAATSGNESMIVLSITNDTTLTTTANTTGSFQGNVVRRRVQLYNQDQTAAIFSWPRNYVKSHTPDAVTIKRQQIVTVASGGFSIDTGNNSTFDARVTDNFTIAVVDGAGTLNDGDVLDISSYGGLTPVASGTNGQQLNITGFDSTDNGAVLKVTFTVINNAPENRDKSLKEGRMLKVSKPRSEGGHYGTCYDDAEISLGISDAYKIRGIYHGVDGTPLPPNAQIQIVSGTFQLYETIVGQTSGARAKLIDYNGHNSTSYWYLENNINFTNNETIVGQNSEAVATVSDVSKGSPEIKSRFAFDDGQRDGFYDLAKLIRKPGNPAPNSPILIVFDYFTAANSGDFYDVNSYSSIDYKTIPVYSPSKIDLGGLEPDGTFELSDALDFRPSVGQILGDANFYDASPDATSPTDLSATSGNGARYAPFSYENGRSFLASRTNITQSNSSTPDTPSNGTSVVGDIDFYVGRIDKVFLHKSGQFEIASGIPALTPTKPKAIDECIELFEVQIPPYTLNLKDVRVKSKDHRRFTMADIGKINNRVTNLERITSLSLLEKDTQSKQILDADGFDRFKSGFLVDNFRGHRVGDVNHPDYNCAIDAKNGTLRPKSFEQFFDISLNSNTSQNYQKTGDLITLPYSQISYVNQSKASRNLNVNPYHVFAFTGQLKLSPATDIWQDTTNLPEVRINREGNFDAVLQGNDLGTVWNNWQQSWVGEPVAVGSVVEATSEGFWTGDPSQGGEWTPGIAITREITETPESQTRTGISTSVVEDFVETRNDRIVSVNIIPFMRARTIEIDVTNLKPKTNHFVFFDGIDVNQFVRPYNANFSQDGGVTASSGLITNGNGRLRAYFDLPNSSVQRFPTGSRKLEVTSSSFNLVAPDSRASAVYTAQGLLQSSQTEIVSTRNGRVVIEHVSGERRITRRGEELNSVAVDEIPPVVDRRTPPVEPPDDFEAPIIAPPAVVLPPDPPPVIPERPFVNRVRAPRLPDAFDRRFVAQDGGWRDPLAQSFLVEADGGMFLTSIDLYFKTKSDTLPVSVEVRNMVNGYPGQVILPFSEVTKNPADVNISSDGSVATTFTFDSPVYVEENAEMCFVVLSNSNDYEVFISRMGEQDLITGQVISGQPYAGSLFLSQNASTWTAEQTDDMKFNLKIAKFDTAKIPVLNFENSNLPTYELQENPIESFADQSYVKVYNYSHGMYDTSSNVTISGVRGDKLGSVTNITAPSTPSTGTIAIEGVYEHDTTTSSANGSGVQLQLTVTGTVGNESISSVKIMNPGLNYLTTDTLTVTNFGSKTMTLSGVSGISVGDTIMNAASNGATVAVAEVVGISTNDVTIIVRQNSSGSLVDFSTSDTVYEGGSSTTNTVSTAPTNDYTNTLEVSIDAIDETIGGYPIGSINSTFTTVANTEIDSFTITPSLTSYDFISGYNALESVLSGGENASTTRNYYYDCIHTMIPNLLFKDTRIHTSILGTHMKSPEGVSGGTSYQIQSSGDFITLNDNVFLSSPKVVASEINETNEMSSKKSFTCKLQLQSFNSNVSPVIDSGTIGAIAIMNRLNDIDSSSDVANGTTYIASTEPDGDNNAFVYCTRKVNLKTPATAVKVTADLFRPPTTDIKFMYKILKNDDTTPWDDLGWEYFNTNGSADTTISNDARNFKEYEFTAENLAEFSAFAVKIVGQGTNSSVVPLVSALRCIALST